MRRRKSDADLAKLLYPPTKRGGAAPKPPAGMTSEQQAAVDRLIHAEHEAGRRLRELPISIGAAQRASSEDAGSEPATLKQLVGSQRRGVLLRKLGAPEHDWPKVLRIIESIHAEEEDRDLVAFQ